MLEANRRIANNSIYLTIRMVILTLIGLYTGRVVLDELGVENYGIYGVVGSIVTILSFLNAALSGASSRFITYEIGSGNRDKLNMTFSASLIVHILLAVVILILAETIGIWFFNNVLEIPDNRRNAAFIVYQISIMSAMLSIMQVPFNACIIAHENMKTFSTIEVLNSFLKLGTVFALSLFGGDKLLVYAWLLFLVSIIIIGINVGYSLFHYPESRSFFRTRFHIIKKIWSYSLFNLFSSVAYTGRQQGIVFLINIFFGVAVNAAAALAATVSGIIQGFVSNLTTSVRPQIIGSYAKNDKSRFNFLVENSILIMVLFMCTLSFPFVLEMQYILGIWLKDVPEYTAGFCQLSLLAVPFAMAETVVNIANSANGNIKQQSILSGLILLLQLVVVYLLFKVIPNPLVSSAVSAICCAILLFVSLLCCRKNIPYLNIYKLLFLVFKIYITCVVCTLPVFIMTQILESSLMRVILVFVFTWLAIGFVSWRWILNDGIKRFIYNLFYKLKIKKL